MSYLRLLIAAFCLLSGAALATPGMPRNGAEFFTLTTPQASVDAAQKVEVIEFFMYHCPACNALEPALTDWLKRQSGNIVFRRIHLPHDGVNDPEAHLFLTLQAMGNADALHDKVLQSWHVERRRLMNDADNLNWAIRNGLDKAKFLSHYHSAAVKAQLKKLPQKVASYGVNSTPTFVIQGKYLTSPSQVIESNRNLQKQEVDQAAFQVIDFLVAKAQREH